jgi:hypothetical protein
LRGANQRGSSGELLGQLELLLGGGAFDPGDETGHPYGLLLPELFGWLLLLPDALRGGKNRLRIPPCPELF